jgi:membrane-anchored mycosin MYCP
MGFARVGPARVRMAAGAVAVAAVAVVALPGVSAAATDPQSRQWYLSALDVPAAHKISTGRGVVVGVLESGVQNDHPDLAGQVLDGTDFTPDDRFKGHYDSENHGTGVAGIIAGIGGPGHMLGIAPGAKILPVHLNIGIPGGEDLTRAVEWAVDHGAKVINLSNGTKDTTDDNLTAVHYALAHDVVVVAAAGNTAQGDTAVISPASIPGVIAVGGTDRSGNAWSGSTHGPELTLVAPAQEILTVRAHDVVTPPGGYILPSGTSASTPMVAGAVALIREKYPQLHVADIIQRLITTADDLGPPGHDPLYGFGRLNIVKALTAEVPPVARNPLIPVIPSALPGVAAKRADGFGGLSRGVLVGAAGGAVLLLLLVVAGIVLAVLLSRRGRRAPAPWPGGVDPSRPPPPLPGAQGGRDHTGWG